MKNSQENTLFSLKGSIFVFFCSTECFPLFLFPVFCLPTFSCFLADMIIILSEHNFAMWAHGHHFTLLCQISMQNTLSQKKFIHKNYREFSLDHDCFSAVFQKISLHNIRTASAKPSNSW